MGKNNTNNSNKPKNKSSIIILSIVIIVIIVVIIIGISQNSNYSKIDTKLQTTNNTTQPTTIVQTTEETTVKPTVKPTEKPTVKPTIKPTTIPKTTKATINYNNFIGNWTKDGKSTNSVYNDGGALLKIDTIDNRNIQFSFCTVSLPPYNRVAETQNIYCSIDNRKGVFEYTDSWNNEGYGTIELLNNKIKLTLVNDISGEYANASVAGNYLLEYTDN